MWSRSFTTCRCGCAVFSLVSFSSAISRSNADFRNLGWIFFFRRILSIYLRLVKRRQIGIQMLGTLLEQFIGNVHSKLILLKKFLVFITCKYTFCRFLCVCNLRNKNFEPTNVMYGSKLAGSFSNYQRTGWVGWADFLHPFSVISGQQLIIFPRISGFINSKPFSVAGCVTCHVPPL